MKYLDEFRDSAKASVLVREIEALVASMDILDDKPLNIMEVCGGHTHSIFRYGVEGMLPKQIELVHGPGCPVCVLPMGRVDDCVAIAEQSHVIFTTFGDAMRVPGSKKSLLQAKADGADVRMVYSPMDALAIARANPTREVVFFGLGFETTTPSTALTILQAENDGVTNFSVFCNHITIVPTIKAILDSPDLRLDGFLGPGHVSMVIGTAPYEFIAKSIASRWSSPASSRSIFCNRSGWSCGRSKRAAPRSKINTPASFPKTAMRPHCVRSRAFTNCVSFSSGEAWDRSITPESSCATNTPASTPSESSPYPTSGSPIRSPANAARCSKGSSSPGSARSSGRACTPETPLGALMVSSEGACAAHYQYGGVKHHEGAQ